MELFNGTMAKSFRDNGKMEQKMATEYGNHQKATFTKVNGS